MQATSDTRQDTAARPSITGWGFAVALLLVFITLSLRGAAILINPQPIWDDKNFIADGIVNGGPQSWFYPYAGYILVLPRLLSDGFTVFNLLHAPLWEALCAIGTMSWAFCLILSRGFDHLLPLRPRIVLVAAITLMPWHTEVFAALCNIHWLLFLGLALLSLAHYKRMSLTARWLLPAATVVLIFSTANSVLALPVFMVRAVAGWRTRQWYAFWYGLGASTLIIAYAVLTVTVTSKMPSSWPGTIELFVLPDPLMFMHFLIKGIGYKVVTVSTVGARVAARTLANSAAYTAACVAWLALVAVGFVIAQRRPRIEITLSLVAVTYFTLATIVFGGMFRSEYIISHFIRDGQYYGADRYFVVPTFFFYVMALWVIQHLDGVRRWPVAMGAVACVLMLAASLHFVYPAPPDFRWRENVLNYYEVLLAARGAPRQFRIVVHPPSPEWNLVLPVYELSPADRGRVQLILERHGRM